MDIGQASFSDAAQGPAAYGGYLGTAIPAPGSDGTPFDQPATVNAYYGNDRVIRAGDGSFDATGDDEITDLDDGTGTAFARGVVFFTGDEPADAGGLVGVGVIA